MGALHPQCRGLRQFYSLLLSRVEFPAWKVPSKVHCTFIHIHLFLHMRRQGAARGGQHMFVGAAGATRLSREGK